MIYNRVYNGRGMNAKIAALRTAREIATGRHRNAPTDMTVWAIISGEDCHYCARSADAGAPTGWGDDVHLCSMILTDGSEINILETRTVSIQEARDAIYAAAQAELNNH